MISGYKGTKKQRNYGIFYVKTYKFRINADSLTHIKESAVRAHNSSKRFGQYRKSP